MERLLVIASVLCMCAAALLLVMWNLNGAFVAAVLGVVAWFLAQRVMLAPLRDEAEARHAARIEEEAEKENEADED